MKRREFTALAAAASLMPGPTALALRLNAAAAQCLQLSCSIGRRPAQDQTQPGS